MNAPDDARISIGVKHRALRKVRSRDDGKSGRVRQIDVAKRAGVHVSTVSLALRNSDQISPRVRDRIRTLALEMGYVPDAGMQRFVAMRGSGNIKRGSRGVLAYICSGRDAVESPQGAGKSVFAGALAAAVAMGYTLERIEARGMLDEPAGFWRALAYRGIRGVLVESSDVDALGTLRQAASAFCAVAIGNHQGDAAFDAVQPDNEANQRLGLRMLAARGFRRIGFLVHADPNDAIAEIKTRQCVEACETHGFAKEVPLEELIWTWPGRDERKADGATESDLRKWIQRNRFDVLVSTDLRDHGLLAENGVSVPDCISLAGIGYPLPGSMAGVDDNSAFIGGLAVELLSDRLRQGSYGECEYARRIMIGGVWNDGSTLKRAQGPDEGRPQK